MVGDVLLISSLDGKMIQCAFCGKKWFDSWVDVDGVEVCRDCFDEWSD